MLSKTKFASRRSRPISKNSIKIEKAESKKTREWPREKWKSRKSKRLDSNGSRLKDKFAMKKSKSLIRSRK